MSIDGITSSQIERLEKLIDEYREQRSRGDAPSIDEFASHHPDLEQQIKDKLVTDDGAKDDSVEPASDATVIWDDSNSPDDSTQQTIDQATQHFDPSSATASGTGSDVSGPNSKGSSSPVEFHEELGTGDVVGGYRLERELGRGGMGVVYEAQHVDDGRRVAVKLLSSDLNRTDTTIERFLKEASLAASLSHPRSTFVYEAGRDGEQFFTVMELMPGKTLNDLIKEEGPLPIAQAVDYILDAVDGLEAAHAAGIVHRDVKPSNCFLTDDSRVKIGDFGLSKSLVADSNLTMTGMFLGTPQFSAPEQIRNQDIDERTDIYALATSLYYLIAGQPPFTGSPAAVLAQIVADKPPALKSIRHDAPKALGKVIGRGMHKEPKKRFQTMADFRAALLPFSSRSSFAAIGLRMAAIGLDITILYVLSFFATELAGEILKTWYVDNLDSLILFAPVSFMHLALMIPYFTICEGLTGRTFGKWLFGLRVMPDAGERPGIVRALIRAILLPGLSFSLITVWRDVLLGNVFLSQIANLQMDPRQALGLMLAIALQASAMGLLCITMRRSNGYRGVHDLLSSTYVSQPATIEADAELSHLPIARSVVEHDLPNVIGGYKIVGSVGTTDSMAVYEGLDASLGRRAWLYTSRDSEALKMPSSRTSCVRPTRPRWLQSGVDEGLHWFAVEAVDGIPFTHVESLPWAHGRNVVAATARELASASIDESLPTDLGEQHLWVDTDGGVKVIDFPWLCAKEEAINTNSHDASANLFKSAVEKCCRGREATGGAQDLRKELSSDEAPDYGEATKCVERRWRIGANDRLSLLMVSAATEFMPFFALSGAASVVVGRYYSVSSLFAAQIIALAIALLPAWIMAAKIKEGGLALRLCEMELRSLSGKRASPLQRIWRATMVWAPALVPITFLMVLEPWSAAGGMDRSAVNGGTLVWITLLCVWAGLLLSTFFAIGSLTSIRRNLQDLLAGTYLVRK